MIVREVKVLDAKKLSQLIRQVEASSAYMLWEAGEREIEIERQKNMIKRMKESGNSTILVAETGKGELTGYLFAIGGDAKRNKHSAYIVVGISEAYRGKGIGTMIFKKLDQWAIYNAIHRLELTVVTQNHAGLSLYQKIGFEIEGIKRDSLLIDDQFVDEYYMSKSMSLEH